MEHVADAAPGGARRFGSEEAYLFVEAPFEHRARTEGLRLLSARPGEKVVEIGFGTGHTLARLTRQVVPGGMVAGVDIARRMALVTKRRLARRGGPARSILLQGDDRLLPLRDVAFDAVTMSFVLELAATGDIPVVLEECRRVLVPGGRLVVGSLDLSEDPATMERVYLAAHRRFPRLVDCRPLPVDEILRATGFDPAEHWRSSIAGISVTATMAVRRGDPATG